MPESDGVEKNIYFLNTFVEFVEADFQPSCAPHLSVQRRMDAMDENRHNEFSIEFAFQAIFLGRIGGVNAENALELFENQLDLPVETIQGTNDFDRQDFGWGMGYKQSPIAQGQVIFAWRTAFLLGFFPQLSSPCIGERRRNAQSD